MKKIYITHKQVSDEPKGYLICGVLGGMSADKDYYVGTEHALAECMACMRQDASLIPIGSEYYPDHQVQLATREMHLRHRDEVMLAAWFFVARGWHVKIDPALGELGTWATLYVDVIVDHSHRG